MEFPFALRKNSACVYDGSFKYAHSLPSSCQQESRVKWKLKRRNKGKREGEGEGEEGTRSEAAARMCERI